ncbi:tetratricopeptide repeat protein [Aerosakkonemataceae cyanobacterium BLCC-F50]|uniref:Tetratricopeptide repeat protein n=1 Tax=Floridaenema flaviceps BLCC-F50 TaxID=3153642 RepID=A0ABV4XL69_9CYAN
MKPLFQGVSITTLFLSICLPSLAQAASNSQNRVVNDVLIKTTLVSQAQPGNFDSKDFNFWANQCKVLENEQNYTEALAACEKAIALQSKVKNPQLWASRSNALFQLKKYAEAIASYNFLLSFSPKDSLALTRRCEALYHLGKNEDAIASCEQALRIDGNWGNASPADSWYNRGLVQRKLGQNEEALTSFEKALNLKSDYTLALVETCGTLGDLGRFEEAISACEKAKDSLPVEALTTKAIVQQKAEKWEDAIATYEQALAINPNNSTSWTNQGILLEKLGQDEKALDSYNRAVKINPKSSLAQVNRCAVFNRLNNYKEALEACEIAVAGDGSWGERNAAYAWNQRSSALIGLKQYQEALDAAERAININDQFAEAWNNKGVSLWNLEKYEEAQVAIAKAVEINPQYSQAWFNYGRLLSRLKEYDRALENYDKALAGNVSSLQTLTCNNILNEDSSESHKLQVYPKLIETAKGFCANILINKTAALWNLKKYENALGFINQAIKLNPKSFEGWYNRALVLLDLGQYDEAFTSYDEADKLNPNSFQVLTGKGLALEKMGEDQKALEAYEAALNVNPNYQPAQQYRDLLLAKFKIQN